MRSRPDRERRVGGDEVAADVRFVIDYIEIQQQILRTTVRRRDTHRDRYRSRDYPLLGIVFCIAKDQVQ